MLNKKPFGHKYTIIPVTFWSTQKIENIDSNLHLETKNAVSVWCTLIPSFYKVEYIGHSTNTRSPVYKKHVYKKQKSD